MERLGALFRLEVLFDRDGLLFLDTELFLLFDDELLEAELFLLFDEELLDTELFLLFDEELLVTELFLLLGEDFLEADEFLFVVCLFTELFLFVCVRFDTEVLGRDFDTLLPLEGLLPKLLLRFPLLETELSFLAIPLVVLPLFTLLLFLLATSLRPRVALLSFLAIPLEVLRDTDEFLFAIVLLEFPREFTSFLKLLLVLLTAVFLLLGL